jgi:hypothetical protein
VKLNPPLDVIVPAPVMMGLAPVVVTVLWVIELVPISSVAAARGIIRCKRERSTRDGGLASVGAGSTQRECARSRLGEAANTGPDGIGQNQIDSIGVDAATTVEERDTAGGDVIRQRGAEAQRAARKHQASGIAADVIQV